MRIGIIGGGSIGLLFSYYLSDKHDVTLYTNTFEQAESLIQNGLQLISKSQTFKRYIKADVFENWTGNEDITFIAVKQYHLNEMINQMIEKQKKLTDFVFIQNGMGHIKYLSKLHAKNIYVCSIEHGAYKKNQFTVEHNGVGQTKLAIYQGENCLPDTIFSIPNFPIVYEPDYLEMLLKKLVVNAVINPLTALLKVTNGEIIKNEHYFYAAKSLFLEISKCLSLKDNEEYFHQVLEVCQKTSLNRSSMLKDMESNRLTEIDAIIGYILEEAEKKQITAPICQMLYDLIKGSER